MARKSWLTIVCSLAFTFALACTTQHEVHVFPASSPTPVSGPAAAVQTNEYKAVGVVKGLNAKERLIEIDHGDVEGLMPAMQMEFPVTDANLLNGLEVNDRIDFTIENATDGIKVVAIKKL